MRSIILFVIIAGMRSLLLPVLLWGAPAGAETDYRRETEEARAVLAGLVAADTSNPPGNEARAVSVVVPKLREAGIPFEVTEFAPGRQNVVARLKGSGAEPPILLLSHGDVPGAGAQAWTSDPHALAERGGYLFGRGVYDMHGMSAIELQTLLMLKRSGVRLRRDVIWAMTGDEQGGGGGIKYLLEKKPGSIKAALAFNEGAGLVIGEDGRLKMAEIQVGEKTYQDFKIEVEGPGGHASVPLPENAIYRLSEALARLGRHRFPVRLTPAIRGYLSARAALEPKRLADAMRAVASAEREPPAEALAVLEANPTLSANLRTTCVATLLRAGTRVNTLPEKAEAELNCRLVPGETIEEARKALLRVLADPRLKVTAVPPFISGPASPLEGPGPDAVRKVVGRMWPGLPIVPVVSRSATDSVSLRAAGIPCYGIHPIAMTEADARAAHGSDERIRAEHFRKGLEFYHRLVLELAAN